MSELAPLGAQTVESLVARSHGDSDGVRALVEEAPAFLNAAWDWGGGDWETGLGAAAHMGRRDGALFLLERGPRLDLYAAAMLGEVEIVRAVLAAFPRLRDAPGPHGTPLVEHARGGGEQAREVLELLEEGEIAR